ncbi:MAG: hypothetical protein SFX72_02645 [Isosphaeraceae bacterium]|nr:hypothetical protein [Isosphaeraceae bacterium]
MCADFDHPKPRKRSERPLFIAPTLAAAALAALGGCRNETTPPPGSTPIVASNSPEAVRALKEQEALVAERRKQEAKARSRPRVAPESSAVANPGR